jgi:hypothetical protein
MITTPIRKVRPIGPTMEIAGAIKSRSPVSAFLRHDVKQFTWIPRTLSYTGTGLAPLWEASMDSGFGSHRKEDGFFERWGYGFVVLPVLLAVMMVLLSVVQPKTNLIADIVQAEFPGNRTLPGEAPMQIAKPEMGLRTVTGAD